MTGSKVRVKLLANAERLPRSLRAAAVSVAQSGLPMGLAFGAGR